VTVPEEESAETPENAAPSAIGEPEPPADETPAQSDEPVEESGSEPAEDAVLEPTHETPAEPIEETPEETPGEPTEEMPEEPTGDWDEDLDKPRTPRQTAAMVVGFLAVVALLALIFFGGPAIMREFNAKQVCNDFGPGSHFLPDGSAVTC
jgi:hypothetical protein